MSYLPRHVAPAGRQNTPGGWHVLLKSEHETDSAQTAPMDKDTRVPRTEGKTYNNSWRIAVLLNEGD